jgi:nucleoid-associated protein YgaU
MEMFNFIKNIGQKLFTHDDEAADNIKAHIEAANHGIQKLNVKFKEGTVWLAGAADSAEVKEKTILMAGNIKGVAKVIADDLMAPQPQEEVEFFEVRVGDSLSTIAFLHYGNPNEYPRIFEANREVIKNPNLIYPGQKIRVPKR